MQLLNLLTLLIAATSALSLPSTDSTNLAIRAPDPDPRGGGGGRSSGGSSSGSSGSSSGSSGSSSGSSGSSSGSSRGGTSGSSNAGGTSSRGSGVQPSYNGRYAGGATTPYAAGARSPRGIVPGLLIGGALGFWVIAASSPYSWGPYGAYRYQYPADISYYNQTSMMNETVAGQCLCRRYAGCSCDAATGDPDDAYVTAVVGDGSYAHQQANAGTYQVSDVDGRRTFSVNGTLANGTTAAGNSAPSQSGLTQKASLLGLVAVLGSAVLSL